MATKSILDILIKLTKSGTADKEVIDGLVKLKRSITETVAVGAALVTAGYAIKKVLDETVGSLVAYADQVRTVQNATGVQAEDASKLIQILDDQKVSFEQLEKAIAKNGKAYDFSVNGIAKMSDEFKNLKTSQEQAAFMQERFGKQWIDFVPVMKMGSQALLSAADAVQDNLVLTQKNVDAARQYEIALDNWNDQLQGLKISIGTDLLPLLTALISVNGQVTNAQEALNTASEKHSVIIANNYEAAQRLRAAHFLNVEAASAHGEALMGLIETNEKTVVSEKEMAEQIKETSAAHQSMLGLITSIASENKSYSEKQAELTQKMAENRAEAELLYPWQKQQLDELNQKYVDMQTTYDQNAAAHNAAMGKIQYDLLLTKLSVDGLTDAEFQVAQQAGLMFGIFDQQSITTATNMNSVANAVDQGRIKVEDMGKALALLPSLKNIDVVINALVSLSSGAQAAYFGGATTTKTKQSQQGGFADGGIATGPSSGHWELLHGTEAIIPLQNGSVPVAISGAGGGGSTVNNISLSVSSPVTVMDQQTVTNVLMPMVLQAVRNLKSQGAL